MYWSSSCTSSTVHFKAYLLFLLFLFCFCFFVFLFEFQGRGIYVLITTRDIYTIIERCGLEVVGESGFNSVGVKDAFVCMLLYMREKKPSSPLDIYTAKVENLSHTPPL